MQGSRGSPFSLAPASRAFARQVAAERGATSRRQRSTCV